MATNKERSFWHRASALPAGCGSLKKTKQNNQPRYYFKLQMEMKERLGLQALGVSCINSTCYLSVLTLVCVSHEPGEWTLTHQSCKNSLPGPGCTHILPKHGPADQSPSVLQRFRASLNLWRFRGPAPSPWVDFPLVCEHLSMLFDCSQKEHWLSSLWCLFLRHVLLPGFFGWQIWNEIFL